MPSDVTRSWPGTHHYVFCRYSVVGVGKRLVVLILGVGKRLVVLILGVGKRLVV